VRAAVPRVAVLVVTRNRRRDMLASLDCGRARPPGRAPGGASPRQRLRGRHLLRNKYLFLRKHLPLRRHPLAWLAYGAMLIPRMLLQSVAVNRGLALGELRTILAAGRDGLRGRTGRWR
jgi:hypothetical protein